MGMKISGIIVFLVAVWYISTTYYYSAGNPKMKIAVILIAASGLFLFLEGIKQEIIAAIKEKDSKEIQQNN